MTKSIYLVKYAGCNVKLQGFLEEITATSQRHAVEIIYSRFFDSDYFPEDFTSYGGLVKDCDGNIIANEGEDTMDCDGGYLFAEKVITN